MKLTQATLFSTLPERSRALQSAIDLLADANVEERGAIFTQPEIIAGLLDLVHYQPDKDLANIRLLEPSCGQGDFLLPIISRLIASYLSKYKNIEGCSLALRDSIRAVELHRKDYAFACQRIFEHLLSFDVPVDEANRLVKAWMVQDDFLLVEFTARFDVVVGNPPYVRQERIPAILLDHYRAQYHTVYDRADLYIPFFERGLSLLAPGGKLAFICSDRWLTNRYGGPLRRFISQGYHLEHYKRIDDVHAFQKDVAAYPAIVVIGEGKGSTSHAIEIEREQIKPYAHMEKPNQEPGQSTHSRQGGDSHPWALHLAGEARHVLEQLERTFPTLEEVGCRVSIGVATGCDAVYIQPLEALPVEDDRKLPLVVAPDIRSGSLHWSGKGIINPFTQAGKLASLQDYPLLAKYLAEHEAQIRKRHIAQKNPQAWFRTIDRIYPQIITQPKLLIPDIAWESTVVYDEGRYYPHHNLYYITSTSWDLFALQAILRSAIARLFIVAYSTRMRGGYLRFQAQYIRRIHIPAWHHISPDLQNQLREVSMTGTIEAINAIAFDLYHLSAAERVVLGSIQQ